MTNNADNEPDELDEDEVTLVASSGALQEIRIEAARVRAEGFDAGDDPTTMMSLDPDLAEEPTIITGFSANEPATTMGFDPSDDPTTIITPAAARAAAVDAEASLIDGKAPPSGDATYWQSGDLAEDVAPVAKGKGPVPKWFLATSMLAVLMAVGLVLLVLWALSGAT